VSQNDSAEQAQSEIAAGHAFLSDGRLDDAEHAFARARQLDPRAADAPLGAGQVELIRSRPTEALQHYEAAVELEPESQAANLGCGKALALEGKLEQAVWRFDQALALGTLSPEPPLEAGSTLLDVARSLSSSTDASKREATLAAADGYFGRAIDADSSLAAAWLGRGQVQLELRSFGEALRLLRQALVLDPSLLEANLGISEAAHSLEDYREALEVIEPVVEAWHPNGDLTSVDRAVKARLSLVFALDGLRRWEDAHQALIEIKELLEGHGEVIKIYREMLGGLLAAQDSSLLLELGRYDKAARLARQVAKGEGIVVPLAQLILVSAEAARGDYAAMASALADAEDMYANAPPSKDADARAAVARLRGAALCARGKAEEAYELLKAECDALPKQVELHLELVRLAVRQRQDSTGVAEATWQHRLQGAVDATRKALEPRKDLRSAALAYGMLDIASDQAERALETLQGAVAAEPDSRQAHALLGAAAAHLGDHEAAARSFAAAARLAPCNLGYKLALGTAYFHLGNADAAENRYREVLRVAPQNVEALVGLGAVLGSREEAESAVYDEATEYLDKALRVAETMNADLRDQCASLRLSPKRRAVIYHQIGCARARQLESIGAGAPVGRRANVLRLARKAFAKALAEDDSLFRAEKAKALIRSEGQAMARAWPKGLVMTLIGALLILLVLSFFFRSPQLDQLDGPTFSALILGLLGLLMAASYFDQLRSLSVAGVSMEKEEVEVLSGKLGIEGDPSFIDLIPLELDFPPSIAEGDSGRRGPGDGRATVEGVEGLRGDQPAPTAARSARTGASTAPSPDG
jgi:tetratricopeptide (TPR) repeat protein